VADESPISQERAEWLSDALQNIGIECVVYPLPYRYWYRSVLFPERYGLERPSSAGPPELITFTRTPHFHHSGDVIWCGTNVGEWGDDATPPGYGNDWDDILMKQFQLPPGEVSLSYSIQYDTEQNYDFVHVQITIDDGNTWDTLMSLDGTSVGYETYTHDLTDYANHSALIRFNFVSDLGLSDEDGFDTEGACRIDWIEVTGHPRDDFITGTDGWEATSPDGPIIEGFDITLLGVNPGGYIPGFEYALPNHMMNQGYSNPEYEELVNRLTELNIDWNVNFPDAPDLSEEAIDILLRLQEIWVEDYPFWVLWGRDYWETGSNTAGWAIALSNLNNEHLTKEEVRQAINLAIDRQGMIDAGLEIAPRTWLVQTPIHPLMNPGFDDISYAEYNVERAKVLLVSAGYNDTQTTPPEWVVEPSSMYFVELGDTFSIQFEARGYYSISSVLISDTLDFELVELEFRTEGDWSHVEGSLTSTLRLPVGEYSVELQVVDIYGNLLSKTVTVVVEDTSAPIPTIIYNQDITYTRTTQIVGNIHIEDRSEITDIRLYEGGLIFDGLSLSDIRQYNQQTPEGWFNIFECALVTKATLEPGGYLVDFECQDVHGNTWIETLYFRVMRQLNLELVGEFDYLEKEDIPITLAAYLTCPSTNELITGASIYIEIYNQNLDLLVDEELVDMGDGWYSWTSSDTIGNSKNLFTKGIYTVKAKVRTSYTEFFWKASDLMEFHIDPPGGQGPDMMLLFALGGFSGLVILNSLIAGRYLWRRRRTNVNVMGLK
jgi:hypothetical protein